MIARRWAVRLGILGAGVAVGVSGGTTVASWTSKVDTPTGTVQAIADWVAPPISDAQVLKREGGTPGFIRPGGEFRNCATVGADSGRPASGLLDFTVDTTSLASSLLAPLLSVTTAATCPAGTNQDSGVRRLPTTATTGTKAVTFTSRDNAGNTRTETVNVVVDATAPRQAAAGFTTTNVAGGTAGRPEAGDTITFAFDEPIDPHSVVPGWTGASPTTVFPYFTSPGGGNADTLLIYSAQSTLLPLTSNGGIALNGNYVSAAVYFSATMEVAGNSLRITLGTVPVATGNSPASATGPGSTTATRWTPGATLFDRAGHLLVAVGQNEPAPLDLEF